MCRSIKPLYNFAPPATDAEIRAAALQFVRKVSGFARPSKANEAAFDSAVGRVAEEVSHLLSTMVTTAPSRDRAVETARARARSAARFPERTRETPGTA